jgi:hypothetical protein
MIMEGKWFILDEWPEVSLYFVTTIISYINVA